MSGVTLSDDRLRRFLLGQLDESDRQEIERACLDPDDTAFSSVAAAEDELRTDYAQGLLSADDRARFAERYLATDDGRARQSFLTGLALLAQRQPVVDPAQTGIARLRLAPWWRQPRGQAGLAAAAIALAAFSAVMLGTVHGLQNRVVRLQDAAAKTAPPAAPATTPADLTRLQEELAREHTRATDLERRLAEATTRPQSPLLAVWLMPGLTRGAGGETPRVGEADVAQGLRVTLALPSSIEPVAAYAAALRDADGKILWSSGPLTIRDRTVTATIPAGLLRRGDYQIILRAGASPGILDDLATYDVRVIGSRDPA